MLTPNGDVVNIDANHEPELFHSPVLVSARSASSLGHPAGRPVLPYSRRRVQPRTRRRAGGVARHHSGERSRRVLLHAGRAERARKINNRTDEPAAPLSRRRYVADKLVAENIGFGVINRVARRLPRAAPTVAKLLNGSEMNRDYVDVSHRVFTTPRWVHFYESEWSVPLDSLVPAVREINAFARTLGKPVTFPIEVRCAAADDIPLSTANGSDRGYIAAHVFWGSPLVEYFSGLWSFVREFDGRPHWGKLHAETAETLDPRYPEWDHFQSARRRADPVGRFTNSYLDRVLGPIG